MITDLLLKLTDRCNLNCSYCYMNEKNTGDAKQETINNISEFIKYLTKIQYGYLLKVHLSGGETTLLDIDYLKRILSSFQNPSVSLNLNTNGSFFTEEHAKLCQDFNVGITLSIDGCKELHNIQRSNSFDKTMEALELMRKYNLNPGHIAVITDLSLNYIDEIHNFLKENDIHNIKMNDAAGFVSQENYTKFLLELNKKLSGSDITECNISNLKENKAVQFGNTMGCSYGNCFRNFLSINQDGDITTCERLFGMINKEDYIFGNINKTLFNDIVWNPKRFELIKILDKRKEKCLNCDVYRLCGSGCYHSQLLNNEDICESRKKLIKEIGVI